MRPSRSLSHEDGYLLIEVVMGAVLVLIVSLGLLSGFDSSTRASSINKQRSVAATLAQTDQERMRSYTVAHLSNLRATVPAADTTVAGVQYTVKERADWVSDATGVANCTNASTQGTYIEITSTVTWQGMGITPAVTAQSLVSPPVGSFGPGQGTAGVQITDRSGAGVPGLVVTLGSYHDITDDNGCVVFGYIPSGNYVASVARAGWVDQGGNNPAETNCAVPDGATVACPMMFDRATTTKLKFQQISYHDTNGFTPATAQSATFTNPKMSSTPLPEVQLSGSRSFLVTTQMNTPNQTPDPLPVTTLFPFTDGYAIVAGSCQSANPLNAPTLGVGHPGLNMPYQLATAGAGQTYDPVTINEPAIDVTVKNAAGQLVVSQNYTDSGGTFHAATNPGATVNVTNVDSACGLQVPQQVSGQTIAPPGRIAYPGFPFGTYTICARDAAGHKGTAGPINNIEIAGTDVAITLSAAGGQSPCPA